MKHLFILLVLLPCSVLGQVKIKKTKNGIKTKDYLLANSAKREFLFSSRFENGRVLLDFQVGLPRKYKIKHGDKVLIQLENGKVISLYCINSKKIGRLNIGVYANSFSCVVSPENYQYLQQSFAEKIRIYIEGKTQEESIKKLHAHRFKNALKLIERQSRD